MPRCAPPTGSTLQPFQCRAATDREISDCAARGEGQAWLDAGAEPGGLGPTGQCPHVPWGVRPVIEAAAGWRSPSPMEYGVRRGIRPPIDAPDGAMTSIRHPSADGQPEALGGHGDTDTASTRVRDLGQPPLGLHLRYAFEPGEQSGADLGNPLFDLLAAVLRTGSIRHAAQALGCSYRYVWGSLHKWEQMLCETLLVWSQGQRSRPTQFAEKLLW